MAGFSHSIKSLPEGGSTGMVTTFKEAACAYFRCSDEQYEVRIFWHCLYRHAIPFAWLIRRICPRFFHQDLVLIHDLERATSARAVREEVIGFLSLNRMARKTIRNRFRLRISGKKVIKLASFLFAGASQDFSNRLPIRF